MLDRKVGRNCRKQDVIYSEISAVRVILDSQNNPKVKV